jgi:hypothetical protein
MKTITLRYGKENLNGQNTFFSTLSLLKIAINGTQKDSGISVSEMSKRIKLLDILNQHPEFDVNEGDFNDSILNTTKVIELEDSDYEKIKELFSEVKWKIVSKFIVELSNELNSK